MTAGSVELPHEEVVQRRIRQHNPDRGEARCDGLGQPLAAARLQQHDGRLRRAEQAFLLGAAHAAVAPRTSRGRAPSRRRPCRSGACAGGAPRRPPALVASQARWKPPRPFMATIAPSAMSTAVAAHRVRIEAGVERPSVHARQAQGRAAARAGDRLGVEAAVGRIGILRRARRAHGERAHRRVGAVVGRSVDDRQARPAMRAIGERVAEAPLGRRPHLGEALGAGGCVRHDGRRHDACERSARSESLGVGRARRALSPRSNRAAPAAAPRCGAGR